MPEHMVFSFLSEVCGLCFLPDDDQLFLFMCGRVCVCMCVVACRAGTKSAIFTVYRTLSVFLLVFQFNSSCHAPL